MRTFNQWILNILLLLTFLTCTGGASAQSAQQNEQPAVQQVVQAVAAEAAPPGAFFLGLEKSVTVLMGKMSTSLLQNFLEEALKIAATTVNFSLELAGGLALLYLMKEGVSVMTGGAGNITQSLVDAALPMCVCSFFINDYQHLVELLVGPESLLASVRNLGNDPVTLILQMYSSLMGLVGRAISSAFSTFGATASIYSPGTTTMAAIDVLLTVIAALGVLVIAGRGISAILGLLLMGPFMGAVGVALGPIFIACLASPWTREYFNKWLGFLVASTFLSGILGICIDLACQLFQTFNFKSYLDTGSPSFVIMVFLILVITTINSLLEQAPSIVSALVPGSFSVSSRSGAATMKALKDDAAQRLTNMAKGLKDLTKRPVPKNTRAPGVKGIWGDHG